MQITVEITDEEAARAADLGLTPEAYVRDLLVRDTLIERSWAAEASRRGAELDEGRTQTVSWEQIEARLRSRVAS